MTLSRFKRFLICLDQLANVVLFNGSPDETVSARSYRERSDPFWANMMAILDAVFFWEVNHCEESFKWELARKDLPENYRHAE